MTRTEIITLARRHGWSAKAAELLATEQALDPTAPGDAELLAMVESDRLRRICEDRASSGRVCADCERPMRRLDWSCTACGSQTAKETP